MGQLANQRERSGRAIALLGRRDEPTDGVEDYCIRLSQGLAKWGWSLELVRVPWLQKGWVAALRRLSRDAKSWQDRQVLVQYTALSWSRRGLPLGFLAVLWVLRRRGIRATVIFHDLPYPANNWKYRLRTRLQLWVMRAAYHWTARSILTLPLENAAWLPSARKASFIPVGTNIPSLDDLAKDGWTPAQTPSRSFPTVAVFGITGGPPRQTLEITAIVHALRHASARVGKLGLLVMGRGAREAESDLRKNLDGSSVTLTVCGLLPARELSIRLACCDAFLYVRGTFMTGNTSGLAAIACGLPMVAYGGERTGFPLTEGGIRFVSVDDIGALGEELSNLMADPALRGELQAENRALFQEWFSWDRIAERFVEVLDRSGSSPVKESREFARSRG